MASTGKERAPLCVLLAQPWLVEMESNCFSPGRLRANLCCGVVICGRLIKHSMRIPSSPRRRVALSTNDKH